KGWAIGCAVTSAPQPEGMTREPNLTRLRHGVNQDRPLERPTWFLTSNSAFPRMALRPPITRSLSRFCTPMYRHMAMTVARCRPFDAFDSSDQASYGTRP